MTPETAPDRCGPAILHGQAHIRGTRLPVSVILDCIAAGMTHDEILKYTTLSLKGIRAAAGYGAALARKDVFPLDSRAS